MFAHDKLDLPANLLPDDVSDLLAWLGYRCDRRNITRALEVAGIPGVVPPGSRAVLAEALASARRVSGDGSRP
jgi:hypothetical protein